jgi:transketolase
MTDVKPQESDAQSQEFDEDDVMEDVFVEKSGAGEVARNIGAVLGRLGDTRDDIAIVVADMGMVAGEFRERHPERFFNFGIAENNTMSAAAGLAAAGMKPYSLLMSAFGMLKCAEQIRTDIGATHLPVRIVARSTGLGQAFFGASHHTIEDIAIARSLANMTVICPSDFNSMVSLIESTVDFPGPIYYRMSLGCEQAEVYSEPPTIERGKFRTVREGTDVTVIGIGNGVVAAIEAAKVLETEGVSVEIIDACYLKPLDEQAILEAAAGTGRILTVEEHSVIGGLGTAVAEVLGRHGVSARLQLHGLPDGDLYAGFPALLLEHYGITPEGVLEQLRKLLSS